MEFNIFSIERDIFVNFKYKIKWLVMRNEIIASLIFFNTAPVISWNSFMKNSEFLKCP